MVNKKTICPIKTRNKTLKMTKPPETHVRAVLFTRKLQNKWKKGEKRPKLTVTHHGILNDKTWTSDLYYPKKLNYLFLAVFAFSSPFCYAKTAFSYSRALLSPCTPVLFMVKDVVKSEYRMIVMWSWFWGGRSAQKSLLRQRRKTYRVQKKHTNLHMWSTIWKEMINMWSENTSSKEQRTASSFFSRCCILT